MTQIQMIQNEIPYVILVLKTMDEKGEVHTFHSFVDYYTFNFNCDTIERLLRNDIPTGHRFVSYEVIDLRSSEDKTKFVYSHDEKYVTN